MAHASIRTTHIVQLELSAEEATWLRAYVQNSLGAHFDPPSDYEDKRDLRIRSAIFEALSRDTIRSAIFDASSTPDQRRGIGEPSSSPASSTPASSSSAWPASVRPTAPAPAAPVRPV